MKNLDAKMVTGKIDNTKMNRIKNIRLSSKAVDHPSSWNAANVQTKKKMVTKNVNMSHKIAVTQNVKTFAPLTN